LKAEGEKQSAILQAQGAREAQVLRAEGYAEALKRIFAVANSIDQKTMTLQYFSTLKELGATPATKFVFPMEFTTLLQNFVEGQQTDK
ncbi:MAG: SPFH/Band 7/PHB domain protein, partial [Anaerolineae bacterium]